MSKRAKPLDYQPRADTKGISDDLAYILPMATFLVFTWIGGTWKNLYPISYVAKAIVVAIMLVVLWKHYTKIRWNHWWLGVIVGVIGIFQWVPMQLWLQKQSTYFAPSYVCPNHPEITRKGGGACEICKTEMVSDAFNPLEAFSSPQVAWAFIVVRIIGAVLIVPVMEELFWRDFLWREIIAPSDFKLAKVGELEWPAFLVVAGAFALVHGNWWLTSIVWAAMVG